MKWSRRAKRPDPSLEADTVERERLAGSAFRDAVKLTGQAQQQLRETAARAPVVAARVAAARRELRRNGLSELFDEALGMGQGT